MSVAILTAGLVVAQQQHEPPPGAHFVLLGGAVVAGLAILGVRWWKGRRDAKADDEPPTSPKRSTERGRSTEDE